VGYPAFWNLVAFYLLLLGLPTVWNRAAVVLFALLHFVPIRFAYPTRAAKSGHWSAGLAAVWLLVALAAAWGYPTVPPVLVGLALGLLAAMGVVSLGTAGRRRDAPRR
jgi:phosphatidylcholine synthase